MNRAQTLRFRFQVAFFIATAIPLITQSQAFAIDPDAGQQSDPNTQQSGNQRLSSGEIDDLLEPIALYPDVLLAQILPAATYPQDVVEAARWLKAGNDINKIDGQPWSESVKAVAHYPDVLKTMDEHIDWTNALGAAYLDQPNDVMNSVQQLRALAKSNGALQTTPQQQVIEEQGAIVIAPANPQVIYVPQYQPQVVYQNNNSGVGAAVAAGAITSAISFGTGLAIGAWCNMDCNWWNHGGVCYRPGWGPGYRGPPGYYWRGAGAWGGGVAHPWGRAPGSARPVYRPPGISNNFYRGGHNNTNVNINRGDVNIGNRTNVGNRTNMGDRTNVVNRPGADNRLNRPDAGNRPNIPDRPGTGGDRPNAPNRPDGAGNRPGQLPAHPNMPDRANIPQRSDNGAFGNYGRGSDARQNGDRGRDSRASMPGGGNTPHQQPSASNINRPSSSGNRSNAFSGVGSGSEARSAGSRGHASRGGGGGGNRGGGRR